MTGNTAAFDLARYLEAERVEIEAALDRAVSSLPIPGTGSVTDALRYGVGTGGKRLRPILCATAYRAVGGLQDPASIYDLAVSIELVHAYSLMHDDLPCMDDAHLRRGKPTPHRLFGEPATTLAGAVLIPGAALLGWRAAKALGLSGDGARAVVRELLEAAGAGGMVGGQLLDLLAEDTVLKGPALDDLHARKTGALLTASLRIGALAGGGSEEVVQAFDGYGRSVGLAFQIADDVLDATSSASALGKVPSDQEMKKSTYVRLHGVDGARMRAAREIEVAIGALDAVGVADPALESLARYVVERDR